MRIVRAVGHAAWRLILLLGMVMLGVLVVTTLLQVVSRYVLRAPLDWTEEVARYVFVWLGMIGAGIAAKDRAHFFVDLVLERLSLKLRRYVAVVVGIVSSVFLVELSWTALELALSNAVQDSPVLTVPMSVPYSALPVGFILMAIFTVGGMVGSIGRAWREDEPGDDEAGAGTSNGQ